MLEKSEEDQLDQLFVRNDKVLHRVKEERNTLHTVKRRKANWFGHFLHRNCLPKSNVDEKIEVTVGR
jgi:hypothetical protein